jgi:hypothetical protein
MIKELIWGKPILYTESEIMEYRNIDEDAKLLHHIKRYYNEEINETQLRYILNDANYSEREIDRALNDYMLVHIKPMVYINYMIMLSIFAIAISILVSLILS